MAAEEPPRGKAGNRALRRVAAGRLPPAQVYRCQPGRNGDGDAAVSAGELAALKVEQARLADEARAAAPVGTARTARNWASSPGPALEPGAGRHAFRDSRAPEAGNERIPSAGGDMDAMGHVNNATSATWRASASSGCSRWAARQT